jgi:fructose-bisphosphate aldolase, class II
METLREVLTNAARHGVAVGHFNVSDLAALKAIVAAARDLKLPVMIGVSEGERGFVGVRQIAGLIRAFREESEFPIFLNADHTHSLEKAEQAARAGFDEIIFDGSSLPFEKNIEQTKKAVELIKSINPNCMVEGEIGYIGSSSEVIDKVPEGTGVLTTPEEAKEFVGASGVDILAPAVGNMHGLLQSMVSGEVQKRLDIDRIAAIRNASGIFMTLHGGSGTNDDDFKRAIKAGMTIVHVNTEIRLAWRRSMEASLAADQSVVPYKLMVPVVAAIQKVVDARLRLFSSK